MMRRTRKKKMVKMPSKRMIVTPRSKMKARRSQVMNQRRKKRRPRLSTRLCGIGS